ncbi:MAG: V-type ATP synthase subunit E [Oscillospiraceae bacterium]|nr:V-type ATP synthase subunit E [Candidatus Ruminococcus equi]
MTGIEKIIKQIESDTQLECSDIIAVAENNAEKIISDAKLEATKTAAKIEKDADSKYKDIIERGKSSAEVESKKTILLAKQQVIKEMIENAKKYLENLSDDEYFDLVFKLIKKNQSADNGVIGFNKKDMSRIDDKFAEKLNSVSDGKLTLSKEPININSGFVLFYNGIEGNCSFDAMFSSMYEKISDRVMNLLF